MKNRKRRCETAAACSRDECNVFCLPREISSATNFKLTHYHLMLCYATSPFWCYTLGVSYTSLRRRAFGRRSLVQSDDSHRRPVYAAQQHGGYRQVAT